MNRIANRSRLLKDLFEHEVLEPALFGHDRVPCDPLPLWLDHVAVKISHPNRILRDHSDLAIAKKEYVARMLQDGRHVRRHKKLPVAKADNDRRSFANGNNSVGFVDRNDRQCKDPRNSLTAFSTACSSERFVLFFIMADKVRDDLGVGLGFESAAVSRQPFL